MIIVGGGLAGLLAGVLNPGSTIYEKGPESQSSHKAVLRMRSKEIFKLTGIPYEKVVVHKAIWHEGREAQPTPRIAHLYSKKVTGKITSRSILDTAPVTRYIPPDNFLQLLREKAGTIIYNGEYDFKPAGEPVISTIPMPMLATKLGAYFVQLCPHAGIYVNRYLIRDCNAHATIYYPDTETNIYRATLNRDVLIVESMDQIEPEELPMVYNSLGILPRDIAECEGQTYQKYGKIYNIDEKTRQNFITQMTLKHNIYSLGRFACWRPKTMLDDVVEDIFVIRRLIEQGVYATMNHKQGEDQ